MNIYKYFNSRDIAEHCKKLGHSFSGWDMALLISQSNHHTLQEKAQAWQEIIDTMPDEYDNGDSLHQFLRDYIDRQKARQANADSFWYKDASHGELIDVMDRTMAGQRIYPDKTPEVKLGLTTSYELTGSELEVLRALMQSTSDEDAANRLGCSKANVRWHVSKILEKTGYRTRMELLIAVAQKNLIIVTPDKGLDDTI